MASCSSNALAALGNRRGISHAGSRQIASMGEVARREAGRKTRRCVTLATTWVEASVVGSHHRASKWLMLSIAVSRFRFRFRARVGCTDRKTAFSAFLFQKKQCDRGRPLASLTFAYGAARCAANGVASADWTASRQVWQLAGLGNQRRRLSSWPPTDRRQATSGLPWRRMIDGSECSACRCASGSAPTSGWRGDTTWSVYALLLITSDHPPAVQMRHVLNEEQAGGRPLCVL
jgi:hypothetical protein